MTIATHVRSANYPVWAGLNYLHGSICMSGTQREAAVEMLSRYWLNPFSSDAWDLQSQANPCEHASRSISIREGLRATRPLPPHVYLSCIVTGEEWEVAGRIHARSVHSTNGRHHFSLVLYQSIVFSSPSSKPTWGFQPRRRIFSQFREYL